MDFVDMGFGGLESSISLGGILVRVLPTHRQCSIEITNASRGYILRNPRIYTSSGRCIDPLPPMIQPSSSGFALFTKTPYTARGSVGIFTYDLLNTSTGVAMEQIAILFKVPFDLNLRSNKYAVGVFDITKDCNRDLYWEMSKNMDTAFIRGKAKGPSLFHKSQNVTIMATMSNCYTPIIKIQVCDN